MQSEMELHCPHMSIYPAESILDVTHLLVLIIRRYDCTCAHTDAAADEKELSAARLGTKYMYMYKHTVLFHAHMTRRAKKCLLFLLKGFH